MSLEAIVAPDYIHLATFATIYRFFTYSNYERTTHLQLPVSYMIKSS